MIVIPRNDLWQPSDRTSSSERTRFYDGAAFPRYSVTADLGFICVPAVSSIKTKLRKAPAAIAPDHRRQLNNQPTFKRARHEPQEKGKGGV